MSTISNCIKCQILGAQHTGRHATPSPKARAAALKAAYRACPACHGLPGDCRTCDAREAESMLTKESECNLSPKMLAALDALRVRGLSSYLAENFSVSTWKALARRDLIELYMDADRVSVRNLVLTVAGRRLSP